MFTSIFDSVLQESSIAPYVEQYNGFAASLGDFYPFALIALCLMVGLFGRRLSGLIRWVLLFAIGFVASVYWVAPLAQQYVPDVPAIAIGLAAGILAAVLSRMIYNFVYIGCIGFDVYNICINAIFLPTLTVYTEGNLPLSIGLAVGAVILALLLRKYLEMIITAAAGGIGIAFFVQPIFDYNALIPLEPTMAMLVVGAVLAVPMFIYQYYNRVIY